ncbi:MAG: hypothetical protein N4A54_11175 [Peptostreptococcaceae bacterium]|jgi:hypothetical protein|nr:hypothetical protein [Peptostreptococcaceae bacterium]
MNNIDLDNLKDKLLGLYLDEAKNLLDEMNMNYKIIQTKGIKDKDILNDKRVINIKLNEDIVFIIVSYFYTKEI